MFGNDAAGRPGNDRDGADGDGTAPAAVPDPSLLPFARLVGRELRLRGEILPEIDEPRYMILLDIYVAMGDARDTPFMSAAHASNVPVSTAQRYIHDLIALGLIAQHRSGVDQRITHISLTDKGLALVGKALRETKALRARG